MPFLYNAWYAAGWISELGEKPLARTFLDQPVVIYRAAGGEPVALSDLCPHRFAPLSLGKVDGDTIRCPYHGLVFDKSGACAHNPHGKGARPAALSVRSYPLVVKEGMLWIWMGDPARSGDAGPPSFPFMTAEGTVTITGYLHVGADYELVTDNLMDLSHAEFLHPFLAPEGTASRNVYRAEQEGDRVTAINEMKNQPNTKLFELLMDEHVTRVDSYANTYWEAPANMYIEVGALALDGNTGDRAVMPQVHLLTPETGSSTHYFWAAGRDRCVDNQEITQMIQSGFTYAFQNEDEPMIREVAARMQGRPLFSMNPALLPMDEAAVRARRILAARIAAEQAESRGDTVAA